jgi:hypothetical protein
MPNFSPIYELLIFSLLVQKLTNFVGGWVCVYVCTHVSILAIESWD